MITAEVTHNGKTETMVVGKKSRHFKTDVPLEDMTMLENVRLYDKRGDFYPLKSKSITVKFNGKEAREHFKAIGYPNKA